MTEIVYPEPYGSYVVKRSTVSLWTRVAGRALMLFSVDATLSDAMAANGI